MKRFYHISYIEVLEEREREREIFKKKVRNSFKKKIVIEEIKYVLFDKKKGSSVFDYEHET